MTVLVIANHWHFMRWKQKWLHVHDLNFIRIDAESDLTQYDPADTKVLPLFRNSKYGREKFEPVFSQALERFTLYKMWNDATGHLIGEIE